MKAFNAGKMGSKKQHYFLKCTFGFDTNDAGAFLYGDKQEAADKQENQNEPLKKRRSQGPSDRMLPFTLPLAVSYLRHVSDDKGKPLG